MTSRHSTDVAIVGGGIIGLSSAWRLAQRGCTVTVIDPAPGAGGASWVAAGMLAPVTEAQFGEGALTAELLESAGLWKDFAADLETESGHDIGYVTSGTLTVALDPSDRAVLDDLLAYQHSLDLVAHRRSASACRTLVPGLAPTVCGGIEVPGDHQVDNRALLRALLAAGAAHGVRFVPASVTSLGADLRPGRSTPAVMLSDGSPLEADAILLAAGIGILDVGGLGSTGIPLLRPVKGHILRLGPNAGVRTSTFLPQTVRGLVRGRAIYLVPRADGSVVVGATAEERGDGVVQAGAVHQLLDDARALVPGIDELTLLEAQVGLRPATTTNTPCIGWTELPGVAVATGHFRHGFLLAPLTAATVVALLADPAS